MTIQDVYNDAYKAQVSENFDLRKYLAEGRLFKEDVMVNPIICLGVKNTLKT
jgi:hypothetical protein